MSRFAPPVKRKNHGRGHSYQDASGARIPGVTTILGNGCPKPALIEWSARKTIEYAVDYWDELTALPVSERIRRLSRARFEHRDAAARRGTEVHKLAEQLATGETVDVPDELAGHVDAYVSFLDSWDVQPIELERVAVSYRYGYAGTFDLIAELRHPTVPGRRVVWLLDIKTTESGVYPETALQLAAYRHATHYVDAEGIERPMLPVELVGVVHVRGDGAELVPVVAGPDEHRTFLYVQQVAAFAGLDKHELIGDPITPPREAA